MGVLDDAIRQHLDLKRQHGADESEVQRKADEALGPARRDTSAAPEEPGVEAVEAETELAPEQPVDLQPDADHEVFDEPFAEEPLPPEPEPEPYADTPSRAVEPIDDPLAEPPPPPPVREGDADEDVLEDTPDFLQETPEHDRLWFEQKPPRDFDFDE